MSIRSLYSFTLGVLAALFLATLFLVTGPVRAQAPQNPSFNLVNHTGEAIREFYATPAGMTNFGQNRLGGTPIPPGGRFAVRLRADGNCIYDMKAVLASGRVEERKGVNTCAAEDIVVGAPATTQASPKAQGAHNDPSFRLINHGTSAVTELYATPAGQPKSTENLLGTGTLAPQAAQVVHLPAGGPCVFDLRVTFADKKAREKKGANLCQISDLPVQ